MTIAAMASGTLIQKHQRQENASVIRPPNSGPTTVLMPNAAPMMPMNVPRCLGGKMSAMIDWERRIRPPPPRPCIARPAMKAPMVGAAAVTVEPRVKTVMAKRNRCLRPNRSPSFPYIGIVMVDVSM